MKRGSSGAFSTALTSAHLLNRFSWGVVGLMVVCVVSLMTGPVGLSLPDVVSAVLGKGEETARIIVLELRLPRIGVAAGVGATLALSGTVFQALLRNPLAEPYILGVSNGCAVGAISGFLLGVAQPMVTIMAFGGGIAVIGIVLFVSRRGIGTDSDAMLLGGVMVGAIGAAIIFLLLYFLGSEVRSAIQWMLGDLASTTPGMGAAGAVMLLILVLGSFFLGNRLNAVALGEEQAAALGVSVRSTAIALYLGTSLVVGIAVSYVGAIGFVGLVVPHILRRLGGVDHRLLLPLSAVTGAAFLVACDAIARSLLPVSGAGSGELPVGAITALIGAPLFIILLRRQHSGR